MKIQLTGSVKNSCHPDAGIAATNPDLTDKSVRVVCGECAKVLREYESASLFFADFQSWSDGLIEGGN